MDGVFMRKIIKRIFVCLLLATLVWTLTLLSDRSKLNKELIRLHIVANSDSKEDQDIKLQVRDAVISSIQEDLAGVSDMDTARAYLQENLPKIREITIKTLKQAGVDSSCVVTLCREVFDTRHYDTFSLPAGVYESLRIIIGEGAGKNWWCVSFPALCVPGSKSGFQDAAVCAGFSETLSQTLSGEDYELRFFFLDVLGKVENILFEG